MVAARLQPRTDPSAGTGKRLVGFGQPLVGEICPQPAVCRLRFKHAYRGAHLRRRSRHHFSVAAFQSKQFRSVLLDLSDQQIVAQRRQQLSCRSDNLTGDRRPFFITIVTSFQSRSPLT